MIPAYCPHDTVGSSVTIAEGRVSAEGARFLGTKGLGTGARSRTTDALFDRSGLRSNVTGQYWAEMAAPWPKPTWVKSLMVEAAMEEVLMVEAVIVMHWA